MRDATLRTHLTRSQLTLPFVLVVCCAVWCAPRYEAPLRWGGLAIALVLGYMLMELANRNQLLRVRSRMVSTTFLALAAASPFLHDASSVWVAPVCLVAAYFLLFSSYQRVRSEGKTFYAFAMLGIGTFFFPPFLFLALVFYASMLVQLRNLTWRTFVAGLFGLAVPVLAYGAWVAVRDTEAEAFAFVQPWLTWERPDYGSLPVWQQVNAAFLCLQVVLGLLHYYRTNFNDKIRVRMDYYLVIMVEVVLVGGLCVRPSAFLDLWPLLLVNSSPLIAHYWTLARGGGLMSFWFVLNVAGVCALGFYNYGLLPFLPQ